MSQFHISKGVLTLIYKDNTYKHTATKEINNEDGSKENFLLVNGQDRTQATRGSKNLSIPFKGSFLLYNVEKPFFGLLKGLYESVDFFDIGWVQEDGSSLFYQSSIVSMQPKQQKISENEDSFDVMFNIQAKEIKYK